MPKYWVVAAVPYHLKASMIHQDLVIGPSKKKPKAVPHMICAVFAQTQLVSLWSFFSI